MLLMGAAVRDCRGDDVGSVARVAERGRQRELAAVDGALINGVVEPSSGQWERRFTPTSRSPLRTAGTLVKPLLRLTVRIVLNASLFVVRE